MSLFNRRWKPRYNNFLLDLSTYEVSDSDCDALCCYIEENFREETSYIFKGGRYEFYTLNLYKYVDQSLKEWAMDRTPSQIAEFAKTLPRVRVYTPVPQEQYNGFPKRIYYKPNLNDLKDDDGADETVPNHVHIFHHFDHDGIFSGRLAYDYYVQLYKDSLSKYPVNSLSDYDFDRFIEQHITMINITSYATILKEELKSFTPKDKFVFVDYSFSNSDNIDFLKYLYEQGCDIEWIDHHATSVKMRNNNEWMNNIKGIVNTTYSAALLSYLWYNMKYNIMPSYQLQADIDMDTVPTEKIPEIIKYVDSYDTWKHYMPNTMEFHYGFLYVDTPFNEFFDSKIWKDKYYDSGEYHKLLLDKLDNDTGTYLCTKDESKTINDYNYTAAFIRECITHGTIYLDIQDSLNRSLCDNSGFEFEIVFNGNKYSVFALNTYPGSRTFKSIADNYDIIMPFNYNGKTFAYSMYNDQHSDLDLSVIAEKLGGGGHAHACGFTSKELLISKGTTLNLDV